MRIIDKILLLTVLPLFFLCSCSKEALIGPGSKSGGEVIVFGVGTSAAMKGTPVTGPTIDNGTAFGVFCYHLPSPDGGTTPGSVAQAHADYMPYNQKVSKSASGCSYTPIVQWPGGKNDLLKFFTYYPYAASNGSSGITHSRSADPSDPYMALTFVTNDVPLNQTDLLYGATDNLSHVSVPVVLNHALTRVTFSAQLAVASTDGATVKITSLKIKSVIKKGVLTVRDFPGTWKPSTVVSDAGDYEMSIANGRLSNVILEAKSATDAYQSLLISGNDLMFIPQPLTDISVEVQLEVVKSGTTTTEVNYFVLPDSNPWAPAEHIHYRLTVARDAIYASAIPMLWEPGGSLVVPLE